MSVAAELKTLGELFGGCRRDKINARAPAREVPDPTPIELPIGYDRPPTMRELVHEYVEGAMSAKAAESDYGTFEEEDDFEEDDPNLLDLSGYEVSEFEMVEEDETGEVITPESPPVDSREPPEGAEAETPVVVAPPPVAST